MTRYFVLVRPLPDEAHQVTHERADAALAWLKEGEASGWFTTICFARTGGAFFWEATSPRVIEAALVDYPLRETIVVEIDELVELDAGFATLHANIDAADAARTVTA
jgi:hypothetical protein